MRSADREYLEELKREEPFRGYHDTGSAGPVKIRILGRGEVAFYQHGERALLLEIIAGRGVIFAPSIRRWDTGARVTAGERAEIVEHLARVMRQLGAEPVVVER